MSVPITMQFPDISAAYEMIERYRREGEERERRAIVRWLRWRATQPWRDAPFAEMLGDLASTFGGNHHEGQWHQALEHAGIDKEDA
jgi:hypothetical protein